MGDDIHFIDASIVLDGVISFHWDFDDGTTSDERDPIHSFSQSDSFNIQLTAIIEGCEPVTVTKTIHIADCFQYPGSEIFSLLNVLPNPNSGNFFVEVQLLQIMPIDIDIFDFNGRKIEHRSLTDKTSYKVEFSDLPNGIYSVRVRSLNEQKIKKVVVVK